MKKKRNLLITSLASLVTLSSAHAVTFRITVTNNAPTNGVALTPLWGGFHNGNFDSYNGGTASQPGLERLAEDGDTSQITSDFNNGLTYIDGMGNSTTTTATGSTAGREDFTTTSGPILPGASASWQTSNNLSLGNNQFFSYASMILPTNDFYVANGNPLAHDLTSLFNGAIGDMISFNIGIANGGVNDAGTEINDFATSAANGLFGIPGGQTGPNIGTDENGVNANVIGDPFAGFANAPGNLNPALNFNNYSDGIATITIERVPEPSSILLIAIGSLSCISRRRR